MKLFLWIIELLEKLLPEPGTKEKQPRLPVLIVDDMPEMAKLLSLTIQNSIYKYREDEIEIQNTIAGAREALRRRKFAIAYLDNRMNPGEITGVEFSRELELEYPDMRIVFYVGNLRDLEAVGTSAFFSGIGKGAHLKEAVEKSLQFNGNRPVVEKRVALAYYSNMALAGILGGVLQYLGFFSWLWRVVKGMAHE